MTESTAPVSASRSPVDVPRLSRDPSFWGITITQFLGAFNDNLFKQLVLLLCIDYITVAQTDYQPKAVGLFTLPFVLLSGISGYLSDRLSKSGIIVWCKAAEIAIAALAMLTFFVSHDDPGLRLTLLMVVLCLLGAQSAVFGPSKYGILPDLFREEDLPVVNGAIQMTTFLAIILGMAAAGFSKEWFRGDLWIVSAIGMGIAVFGTLTSLLIRRTKAVSPQLRFEPYALAIPKETLLYLKRDRVLIIVLIVASLFWFVGGVVQQVLNSYGKLQLQVGDVRTSMFGVFIAGGISVGCLLAGRLSGHRINFRLVTWGTWGMIVSLTMLLILGLQAPDMVTNPDVRPPVPFADLMFCESWVEFFSRLAFLALGVSAGFFIVPLQVFIQTRPPETQKGRMIGAMNLINWMFILLSAVFYFAGMACFQQWNLPISHLFGVLIVVLVPVVIWFHPQASAHFRDDAA
ncbi:MAG: MFS transporter [Planctomycetota bacterium]|nr:MFS transporter [Planctomycetota bacterium]MDA1212501.1 MFS transporter [Planctomycetota bacterium]